jgi:phosphinothricin acetyltransferase
VTPPATIRPADPARDAAACAAIYAPSVASSPTSFELEPPDAAAFGHRIAAYSATHQFLVAERGGEVVGYAYACPYAERPAYRWAVETSVYIDDAHHGEGLGRALYTQLFERLRDQGFRVAIAGVTLPNVASVRLHESIGFEPVGVLRGIGWKLGAWHDVGLWQLRLQDPGGGTPAEPLPPSTVG